MLGIWYLDGITLEQDKFLVDSVVQEKDQGLTVILDETSDPAADQSPYSNMQSLHIYTTLGSDLT